jgi:hypothetical protein
MKKFLVFALLLIVAAGSHAEVSWSYNWDDGVGTALGTYGNVGSYENSSEQAQSGSYSLKGIEDPVSGTPQLYIWWITGLQDGDTVFASLYGYAPNTNTYARQRIWGHYTTVGGDVSSYGGSAGGNETYTSDIGVGWQQVTNTFIFDSNGGANDGLTIEARMYSSDAGPSYYTHYFDTTEITVSRDQVTIQRADGDVIPEPAVFGLLPLVLLFFRRK